MNISYLISVIAGMAVINFFLRAFPFLFGSLIKENETVRFIGKYLPGPIMLLLVIYCLKDTSFSTWQAPLPEIISLSWIIMIHLLRSSVLLSLSSGMFVFYVVRFVIY